MKHKWAIKLSLVLFLLALPFQNFAQLKSSTERRTFSEKVFFGGALGLTIGDITQIDIIPVAGIWVFPQWSVGATGRYSYYSHRGYFVGGPTKPYRTHILGYSVFTQVLPVPDFSEIFPKVKVHGGLMFHAEYERLYLDRRMVDPAAVNESGKTWVDLYLLGGGYRQRLGERAALNIMMLWELSESKFSPYPRNPMLRVNFTVQLK